MNQTPKLIAYIFIISLLCFASCKKIACDTCGSDKPPVAKAGGDQIIFLPIDSLLLDGSSSTDPVGVIASYQWTKILGPGSTEILRSQSVIATVKSLQIGTYQFELTVTDDGGFTGKDTMQVVVHQSPSVNHPPVANAGPDQIITLPENVATIDASGSTDPDNDIIRYAWTKITGRTTVIESPNAAQTRITNLGEGTYEFELTVTDSKGLSSKDKVLITVKPLINSACGSNRTQVRATLILFDTTSNLGRPVATTGNKIVFTKYDDEGISDINIYDVVTRTVISTKLPISRIQVAIVAVGNKIFFAGGYRGDGTYDTYYSNIDIYNITSNTWSLAHLSETRHSITVAVVGNKVLFAGGIKTIITFEPSNKVDIYNSSTDTWSSASLSAARSSMSAVTLNNKVYFAGGNYNNNPSNRIDVYDNTTNSWSASSLVEPKTYLAGIAVDNNIYWAGGKKGVEDHDVSCVVEVRDVNSQTSSITNLSSPAAISKAVRKDDKIIFFHSSSPRFDIYDTTNKLWTLGVEPSIAAGLIMSIKNTIYYVMDSGIWTVNF